MVVAVAVDRIAFDVLQDQVRLARGRDAGVEESCDVRVGQTGQEVALAAEALLAGLTEQARVQELDRGFALEATVAALCEPDVAHAALTDEGNERVGAEGLPGKRCGRTGKSRRPGQEGLAAEHPAFLQQGLHVVGQSRIP